MLGPVARRVDHAQRDVTDRDLVAVAHRVVRVVDAGFGVDADGDAVLECEPAVPGDMVGVRVRLDRADDPHLARLGLRRAAARSRTGGSTTTAIPASSSPTR